MQAKENLKPNILPGPETESVELEFCVTLGQCNLSSRKRRSIFNKENSLKKKHKVTAVTVVGLILKQHVLRGVYVHEQDVQSEPIGQRQSKNTALIVNT